MNMLLIWIKRSGGHGRDVDVGQFSWNRTDVSNAQVAIEEERAAGWRLSMSGKRFTKKISPGRRP